MKELILMAGKKNQGDLQKKIKTILSDKNFVIDSLEVMSTSLPKAKSSTIKLTIILVSKE